MTFSRPDSWVWDFWIARDGETFHLFYLHAPRSLGDPDLRHRNARIGHAVSADLRAWDDLGVVLGPGPDGSIDASAVWTGCVVRDDARWLMFYTGSRFFRDGEITNVETVAMAESTDLHDWTKLPFALGADPERYEVLADGTWHEEAWRDPWVFRVGDEWHMLLTARARGAADDRDRGVVARARSSDLVEWTVEARVSAPGSGFAHLEVPQVVSGDGVEAVVFSCDSAHLAGDRAGQQGGIWVARRDPETGWIDAGEARLLVDESLYAGRIVRDTDGALSLMGFENVVDGAFEGRIGDPLRLDADDDGLLVLAGDREGARA